MKPLGMYKATVSLCEKVDVRRDLLVLVRLKDRDAKGMWAQEKWFNPKEPDFLEALQVFGMEHEIEFVRSYKNRQMQKLIDGNVSALAIHCAAKILHG